jgi:hypothetical protein
MNEPSDQAVIDTLRAELNSRNAALIELAETHEFRMRQWADEVARLKSENAAFYAEKERLRAELIACRVLSNPGAK